MKIKKNSVNKLSCSIFLLGVLFTLVFSQQAQAKPKELLTRERTMAQPRETTDKEYLLDETIYKYNKNGFLTVKKSKSTDSGYWDDEKTYYTSIDRFKYDNKNRIVKKTHTFDQHEQERTEYTYKKDGNLSVEKYYFFAKLDYKKVYKYTKNRLHTITTYNEKGKIVSIETEKYNRKGELTGSITKDKKGKKISSTSYTYTYQKKKLIKKVINKKDDWGNLIDTYTFFGNGNIKSHVFDQYGRVANKEYYYRDGTLKSTYEQDDEGGWIKREYNHGWIIKDTSYDGWEETTIVTYKYKMKGDKALKRWAYYEYQYDYEDEHTDIQEDKDGPFLAEITEYEYSLVGR